MIRFLLLALLAADYAAFLVLDLLGAAAFLSCLLKFFGILLCALLQPRRPEGWLTVGADFFLLFFPALSPVGILIFCAAHAFRLTILTGQRRALWALPGAFLLFGLALFFCDAETAAALPYLLLLLSVAAAAFSSKNGRAILGALLFLGCDLCVLLVNRPFLPALLPAAGVGMWLFYLPSQVLLDLPPRKELSHEG